MKIDNIQLTLNNVFIFKKLESIRKYKKKIKIKIIDFETLIDSFYRFFSKKLIIKNVNNSKSKNQFSDFNNDLTKTLKKTFRNFYNDFNESLFFENKNDTSLITFHI